MEHCSIPALSFVRKGFVRSHDSERLPRPRSSIRPWSREPPPDQCLSQANLSQDDICSADSRFAIFEYP